MHWTQAEFCPPLDSSLFAAIFGDFEDAPEGLVVLRETLNALVAGIEVDVSEFPNGSAFDTNSDSQLLSANTSNSDALGSPLAFLRAAFPDFPIQVLQEALDNASSQQPTLHMEAIVEELLSSELLAQLDSEALDSENSPSGTKPERATAIPRKKRESCSKAREHHLRRRKTAPTGHKIVRSESNRTSRSMDSAFFHCRVLIHTSSLFGPQSTLHLPLARSSDGFSCRGRLS